MKQFLPPNSAVGERLSVLSQDDWRTTTTNVAPGEYCWSVLPRSRSRRRRTQLFSELALRRFSDENMHGNRRVSRVWGFPHAAGGHRGHLQGHRQTHERNDGRLEARQGQGRRRTRLAETEAHQ